MSSQLLWWGLFLLAFTSKVTDEEIVIFELYDILGKKQITKQLRPASEHQVLLSAVQPGIYFYRLIKGNEAVESGKLIIE